MDICYDHILASNWELYSSLPLQNFANKQYNLIDRHFDSLPDRTRMWFSYMKQNNLLFNYSFEEKIEVVLQRMDKRTRSISGMGSAINEIRKHKVEYTNEFFHFFEEIQAHLKNKF
jgi:acyl carrier protein phosphodiesterase